MTRFTRRAFSTLATVGAASLALPRRLAAAGKSRVVVIGGGPGGATTARYIAVAAEGAVEVTLIEAKADYTTCFFSNLYLGGLRSFDTITHGYNQLRAAGVAKVTATVSGIDRAAKTVALDDGSSIAYDRLVVAPGIDFIWDSVPGYSEALSDIAPHAWKAGPQTQLLREKLEAITDGQQILILPPDNPYRCPPAPYERASMMAHYLKQKSVDAKIIILDAKETFSKQGLFLPGWESHYPGMIEWYGPGIHRGVKSVDVEAGTVETDLDTFRGDLINIIPAQRAGSIAMAADLADDSGFCPIEAKSMRSSRDSDVFVIGDSAIAGDMPKSAFAANSQAKVAASAILTDLTGAKARPAVYANACWSLIEAEDAVKVGGDYAARDGRISTTHSFISGLDEPASERAANAVEGAGWYVEITTDIFGG